MIYVQRSLMWNTFRRDKCNTTVYVIYIYPHFIYRSVRLHVGMPPNSAPWAILKWIFSSEFEVNRTEIPRTSISWPFRKKNLSHPNPTKNKTELVNCNFVSESKQHVRWFSMFFVVGFCQPIFWVCWSYDPSLTNVHDSNPTSFKHPALKWFGYKKSACAYWWANIGRNRWSFSRSYPP